MDVRVSDWCEKHVRLSPTWEAGAGRYDLENNPFWREILDAFHDPEVRRITVMKSTQVGGTLTLIAGLLALSQIDPAPSMVVGPDETYTTEVRDRTYANGEESPTIQPNVPPERMRNSRHIDLATARCYLAWSGSPQRLRGRACKRVFRSEIDVYKKDSGTRGGDPLKASAERVKRFFNSLIYDESSPDGEQSPIAEGYDSGHRARWICKCPECGEQQELRFFVYKDGPRAGCGGVAGLKDQDGNYVSPEVAERSAHYVCVAGCRIGQDQKDAFVRSGQWVAEGQRLVGDVVEGTPARGRRHLSYHIWSIHSPTISLAKLAVAYLEARRDSRLRDFFQNWLGLRYETRKRLPEWHVLGERLAGTYRRGTVPTQAWFLTAGVDVQLDGCYYAIRAWGDQCTSWLVDTGYLQRYEAEAIDVKNLTEEELNEYFRSDLKQVADAVVNRYFLMADGGRNPLGKDRLRPLLTVIDTGFRTREVHAFVQSQDERRVRASRGEHKLKPQERFKETIVERPQRGGPSYGTPRRVVNIFTPHYKEAMFEKVVLPPGSPGSWNLYYNVVQLSSDYLRQILNERPTEVVDKQSGRKRTMWKPRHESWGNHYGDCEVYSFAAAEFLLSELETTWDASTWRRSNGAARRNQTDSIPLAVVREYQL